MTDAKEGPGPRTKESSSKPVNAKPNTYGDLAVLVSDLLAAGVNSEQLLIVIQWHEQQQSQRRERHKRRARERRQRRRGRRCCRK